MRTTSFKVYDLQFLADDILGSCGEYHVFFWKRIDSSGKFKRYRGQGSEVKVNSEIFYNIGNVGDLVFTGNETGYLQIWEGRNCIRQIKAHTGPIYCSAKVGGNSASGGGNESNSNNTSSVATGKSYFFGWFFLFLLRTFLFRFLFFFFLLLLTVISFRFDYRMWFRKSSYLE
jgi:hypothetical protein